MFDNDKRITEELWTELLKDVDQNSDGEVASVEQIQYNEFREMLIKLCA